MLETVSSAMAESALRKAMISHWPRYQDLHITHELLPLNKVLTVIPMASTRRTRDAENLLQAYLQETISPYLPVRFLRVHGGMNFLLSPIVELIDGEFVLLDGMHRCLAALHAGLQAVTVAVARPTSAPPPVGPRFDLAHVTYSRPNEEPPLFFEGRELENYRPGKLFVDTAARTIGQENQQDR